MAPKAVVQISREDLGNGDDGAAMIESVRHLASYSWIEVENPTIAVPGIPPRWSPPDIPTKLQKDTGLVYIAQNAARNPTSPLEPLLRSLYVSSPDFDIREFDIITDRNNIRKLLMFIDPSSSRNRLENFTVNAEVIGNTILFNRTETETFEIIGPAEFKGFGHEFEKTYTHRQLPNSTGHHRVISYRFGGLRLIVRHELDGYVSQPTATSSKLEGDKTEADGLVGPLESLSLSATNKRPKKVWTFSPVESKMSIRQEGIEVPLDSTLEIKTRVIHKPLNIHEIAPQIWASQTPNLVRAYHHRGLFSKPKVEDVREEVKSWELSNQKHLKRLVALIKAIVTAVRECGGKAAIQYDEAIDKITVVPMVDAGLMLPKDLYSKWGKPGERA
ncbi:geranylgeranyl pyrophosphate synthetase [Nemania sp. NC0429]|nr:geranylgeranyl pyrophosphate synthetase [Nemania sp. NC0429]